MQNDITNLSDKISTFYAQNGKIPASIKYTNVQHIKDAGLIKSDITNPKTNQQFSNDMQIKITVNHNDYIIEIIE